MEKKNWMELKFPSESVNVMFARTVAAMFASQLSITLEELEDLKVAVSEAVSNSVIHGYRKSRGTIFLGASYSQESLVVVVEDYGCGIPDIVQAQEAGYTTIPQERMGLGLTFIYELMDEVIISSTVGQGTKLVMTKKLAQPTTNGGPCE